MKNNKMPERNLFINLLILIESLGYEIYQLSIPERLRTNLHNNLYSEHFPGQDVEAKLLTPKKLRRYLNSAITSGTIKNVFRQWAKAAEGTSLNDAEGLLTTNPEAFTVENDDGTRLTLDNISSMLSSKSYISMAENFVSASYTMATTTHLELSETLHHLGAVAMRHWLIYFGLMECYNHIFPYFLKFLKDTINNIYQEAKMTSYGIGEYKKITLTKNVYEQINPMEHYEEIMDLAGYDLKTMVREKEAVEITDEEYQNILKWAQTSYDDPKALVEWYNDRNKIIKEFKNMKRISPPIIEQIERKIHKVSEPERKEENIVVQEKEQKQEEKEAKPAPTNYTSVKISKYLCECKFNYFLLSNPFQIPYRTGSVSASKVIEESEQFSNTVDAKIYDPDNNVVVESIYKPAVLEGAIKIINTGINTLPSELHGCNRNANMEERAKVLTYILSFTKDKAGVHRQIYTRNVLNMSTIKFMISAGLIYGTSKCTSIYRMTKWMDFLIQNKDVVGKLRSPADIGILSRVYMFCFLMRLYQHTRSWCQNTDRPEPPYTQEYEYKVETYEAWPMPAEGQDLPVINIIGVDTFGYLKFEDDKKPEPEVKPEIKPVVKPEPKPEIKPEIKSEPKPEIKPAPVIQVPPARKVDVVTKDENGELKFMDNTKNIQPEFIPYTCHRGPLVESKRVNPIVDISKVETIQSQPSNPPKTEPAVLDAHTEELISRAVSSIILLRKIPLDDRMFLIQSIMEPYENDGKICSNK